MNTPYPCPVDGQAGAYTNLNGTAATETARRILVVEDGECLREMLGLLLREDGYSVLQAGDGLDGLQKILVPREHYQAPDLVILDLMMPRMNGEEFLSEFEARGLRQGARVMALSAMGPQCGIFSGLKVDTWVEKPFEVKAFLSSVRRLIDSGHMAIGHRVSEYDES